MSTASRKLLHDFKLIKHMALNPDLLSFFFRKISVSNMHTFGSEVAHLFEHLESEIKVNQVYASYEDDRVKWNEWPHEDSSFGRWNLPSQFQDAKSLVYSLYRKVAEDEAGGISIPAELIQSSGQTYDDAIFEFNQQFLEFFERVIQEIVNANPELETSTALQINGDTVFVVHGHDTELKNAVQLLLIRAGVNHIVLHEQADKGRTIIDKLIEESAGSNYAIALLSPDDVLGDGSKRARQNVILEIGYFIGRLGKNRVRLLKKGDTEVPSDLSGILYENYDIGGAWKMKICKELIAVGIHVDMKAVAEKL